MAFVLFIGVLFSFLLALSFFHTKKNDHQIEYIYSWAWPIGAFVWEDLFIFSVLGLIGCVVTIMLRDIRIGYLFFVVFWVVRSAGETLYFFFQQFSQPTAYPHVVGKHFTVIRRIFGKLSDQKCFILMQVFHQSALVCSLVLLIILLLNWPALR